MILATRRNELSKEYLTHLSGRLSPEEFATRLIAIATEAGFVNKHGDIIPDFATRLKALMAFHEIVCGKATTPVELNVPSQPDLSFEELAQSPQAQQAIRHMADKLRLLPSIEGEFTEA